MLLRVANNLPSGTHGPVIRLVFGNHQHCLVWEVLPWANRFGSGEMGVRPHVTRRDVVALAQVGDQSLGCGELTPGRRLLVKVADQANADSVLIGIVGASVAAVRALLLVIPALGDFDLAVGAAAAVADDEVISAAVDSQKLTVFRVDLVIVAFARSTVVEHNIAPRTISLVGV